MPSHAEQLELPDFAHLAKPLAIAKAGSRRQRKALIAIPDRDFPLKANCAINAEGVTWTQYAMMVAISGEHTPPTIAGVGLSVGMSYHAVRNQATRTNWFEMVDAAPLTRLRLSRDGEAKFSRITARLASNG
jgi:hypothetical protein